MEQQIIDAAKPEHNQPVIRTQDTALTERAFEALRASYDHTHGGFGHAPKFPTPHTVLFLLRYWKRTRSAEALEMATATLDAMRRGGIYDHVGFGFHRLLTRSSVCTDNCC